MTSVQRGDTETHSWSRLKKKKIHIQLLSGM